MPDLSSPILPRISKAVALLLVAVGAFFRFANLDLKVYGHDEMHTLVRVAGFTRMEPRRESFGGREIGPAEIQKFQRPTSEKDWTYILSALATDDPQHTPVFFLLTRFWIDWFGNSAAVIRSAPALLSVLMFPCLYWLCRELFGSSLVAWTAMAVVAVSPFHVLYAQEARPYSLLSLAALLSSAALLRAMRVQSMSAWGMYAATAAFGMYSHLLLGFVAMGHAVYVIVAERFRLTRLSVAYMLSAILAAVMFIPWMLTILGEISSGESLVGGWSAGLFPVAIMAKKWAGDFGRIFVDSGWMGPEFRFSNPQFALIVLLFTLSSIAAVMVCYSFWFLWRNATKRESLFVFIMVGSTSLPLITLDFVLARHVSASARYLLPAYLGIQLSLSYLLAATVEKSASVWRPRIWQLAGIVLLSSGLISCFFMSRSAVWWNHDKVYHHPSVARIVNRSGDALLIAEGTTGMEDLLSLSYLLNPKIRIRLIGNNMPELSGEDRDIFLFRPSAVLRKRLDQSHQLEPAHHLGGLWQLKLAEAAQK